MVAQNIDKIALLYEKFFTDILNVYIKQGWYEPASISLDLLERLSMILNSGFSESVCCGCFDV
jgi:hypothetical protein